MAQRMAALSGLVLAVSALRGAPAPLAGESPTRFQGRVKEELTLPPPFGATKPLPRLSDRDVARYKGEAAPRFGAAVRNAQLALWASSSAPAPALLAADVKALRANWHAGTVSLKRAYLAPAGGRAAEARFREALLTENKAIGRLIWHLNATLDELKAVEKMRGDQPLRWQANYDLVRGCLQAQLVVLEHHQLALGAMRREMLPINLAVNAGWRLVPCAPRVIDRDVRELVRTTPGYFDRVMREHPGTVWAELARRAKALELGLEWGPIPRVALNAGPVARNFRE